MCQISIVAWCSRAMTFFKRPLQLKFLILWREFGFVFVCYIIVYDFHFISHSTFFILIFETRRHSLKKEIKELIIIPLVLDNNLKTSTCDKCMKECGILFSKRINALKKFALKFYILCQLWRNISITLSV